MYHKLINVAHEEYNTLQIIVRHEEHSNEEETGYYIMVSMCKIVEGNNPSIKSSSLHGRQFVKKSKKDSLTNTEIENIVKKFRVSINSIFNLSLLDCDF